MRLDHLLSKEEEVRVGYTVLLSRITKFPVSMRLGDTPVPIPNTMVKTQAADDTILETVWESRWMPEFKKIILDESQLLYIIRYAP